MHIEYAYDGNAQLNCVTCTGYTQNYLLKKTYKVFALLLWVFFPPSATDLSCSKQTTTTITGSWPKSESTTIKIQQKAHVTALSPSVYFYIELVSQDPMTSIFLKNKNNHLVSWRGSNTYEIVVSNNTMMYLFASRWHADIELKKKIIPKATIFLFMNWKTNRMHNGCSANPCFTLQLTQKETSTF